MKENRLNPPTEAELDWLDAFLLTRVDEDLDVGDKDEGIYDLSTLDGFFTAVVSGPEAISPAIWIQSIWGDFEPEWKDQQQAEKVLTLLARYMNGVAAFLMHDPKNFEPMFMESNIKDSQQISVEDWCEGYMRGVKLLDYQWQQQSPEMEKLLEPIKAFTVEFGPDTYENYSDKKIVQLQKLVTPNALQIHAHWLKQRSDEVQQHTPIRHSENRPGRNDPCSCGSGKKYKKCCLH